MKLPTFEYYFCLCLLILAIEAKDYYKILGIRKSATDKEIKKAFREKARILHPDKNPSPDAEQQFSDLAEAYEVLSDPEKRQIYNQGGRKAFKPRATYSDVNFDDLFKHFEQDIFGAEDHFKPHFKSHFAHHKAFSFDDIVSDNFDLPDIFPDEGFFGQKIHRKTQHCETVTKRVNNMVTTFTHCS